MKSGRTERRRNWVGMLSLLLVIGTIWFFWARPHQWSFRRELPWSAKDIRERYWSDGFLPDYQYWLRARITEEQFRRYVEKLELTPHSSTREYSDSDSDLWLRWNPAPGTWWDPSESLDHTFVWQGSDTWAFAKYERGYLYLASLNH